MVGWSQGNERSSFMMNEAGGGMNGWMGGGMWPVIGVLVVILPFVVIQKVSKR